MLNKKLSRCIRKSPLSDYGVDGPQNEWCKKHNVAGGEGLVQSDDPIIEAPHLLAEIIDDVLMFKYKSN